MSDIEFKDFIKFYKDCIKELFSFLVNDTTLPSDKTVRFGKKYYKFNVNEKIKTADNKIEQNKAQYNLEKQTAKVRA